MYLLQEVCHGVTITVTQSEFIMHETASDMKFIRQEILLPKKKLILLIVWCMTSKQRMIDKWQGLNQILAIVGYLLKQD